MRLALDDERIGARQMLLREGITSISGSLPDQLEEGNAVIDQPDTPTSQSTARRWTFYRRFGLLMRSHIERDGTTLSLHDVAARTRGRVSADQLIDLLERGAQAQPDAVTCVLLAQAFGVDPDYFVDDSAVTAFVATRTPNRALLDKEHDRVLAAAR